MPILIDTEDIYSDKDMPLRLEFDLIGLETYADKRSEGWIRYEISLVAGKNVLVKTDGTIHDNDIRYVEKIFANLPKGALGYKPLEPDFEFEINYIESLEEWTLACMINYGEVKRAYYGNSAIGFRILISDNVAKEFAKDLNAQRISFTHDTDFKNYEAKSINHSSHKDA